MASSSRDIQVINNELFVNLKVSQEVKCELLEEMNNQFNTEEQRIFVNSFYSYLNYHPTEDFIINLSDVYKHIGFTRIDHAKRILVKKFIEVNDYQIISPPSGENSVGRPKEEITMNVETFKGLCMVSGTEKAREIRSYFLKLESVSMSVIKNHLENKKEILFSQDEINNSRRLLEHFGPKGSVFYMLVFKYLEEQYAKIGIVMDRRQLHTRFGEHQSEFGEVCLHLVIQCSDINTVEAEFKETSFFRTNKVTIPKKSSKNKNKPSFHTEILKLSELVTTETIKEKMKLVAGDRITDPPPMYTQETASSSLEIEKERTRQIQEKEKTKQLEKTEETKQLQIQADKELELKKLELAHQLELKKLEMNNTPIQQVQPSPTTQRPATQQVTTLEKYILSNLEISKESKILLSNIIKRYPDHELNKSTGYGNYHGYSKELKDNMVQKIKDVLGVDVKREGPMYFVGLKFINHTSFYKYSVYEEFVKQKVQLFPENQKFVKIPPGEYKYKVRYETLLDLFGDFTEDKPSLYIKRCSTDYTNLFKKEFVNMICRICDISKPSYTGKSIKYFNGITLRA
jgi:phage anti-repressor protein